MPPQQPQQPDRRDEGETGEDLYKASLRKSSRIRLIDRLLHGRTDQATRALPPVRHHRLHTHAELYEEAPKEWDDSREQPAALSPTPVASRPSNAHWWVWAIFLGSFLFFLGGAAFALYVWFADKNAVSVRNIDLMIEGPLTVAGGEEAAYTITIRNRNPMALHDTILFVDFPQGVRFPEDLATPLRTYHKPLGDLQPGEERVERLRVVMFGNQGEEKQLKSRIEYSIEGSRATYVKEAQHTTTITSSPVVVRMSAVAEVVSGQPTDFLIEVINNSERTLENLLVAVRIPPGMRFLQAQPEPETGTNLWRIASLPPKAQFPIRLTVLPTGVEGEVRTFHVSVGEENPQAPATIAAEFGSLLWDVRVAQPFVQLALTAQRGQVQQQGEVIVVPAGSPVTLTISYRNTLPAAIYDLTLEARLRGVGFTKYAVEPDDGGFYDSAANVIRWHPRDVAALREVPPGEGGAVSFTIVTQEPTKISTRAPRFHILVHAKARRLLETQVPETLEAAVEREVRLATTPHLMQLVRYTEGPFSNTGPVPPKVDERTTYTITWRIINPLNELRNLRLSAQLPSYVEWVGAVHPSDARVRYNPVSGEVVWFEDSVPAGVGVNRPPLEMSFQVAIRPSAAQVGDDPVLVHEVHGEATDAFTNTSITLKAPAVTTDLSADTAYGFSKGSTAGRVVP